MLNSWNRSEEPPKIPVSYRFAVMLVKVMWRELV